MEGEQSQSPARPPLHVHPARLALLERPDADELKDVFGQYSTAPPPGRRGSYGAHRRTSSNLRDVSRTGANCASVRESAISSPLKSSLRDVVHRQWDHRRSISYEELLEKRRREHVTNVDRYVPAGHGSSHPRQSTSKRGPFPFARLPDKVKDRLLSLLLIGDGPILIDFTWLRPFINGHSRVPAASKTIADGKATYSVSCDWNELTDAVKVMRDDLEPFKDAMEVRGDKTRKSKSPSRGLTTGLLMVSQDVHKRATAIFYGRNTFQFPWATTAWMQLESFLATIGPANIGKLRSIGIHAPLWHRGMQEDFVEGAMLDLTSPASRLAVVTPAPRDRLLSAVKTCTQVLAKAGSLENLSIDLEHGMTTDRWIGRYSNDRQMIAVGDAEEHVARKQHGIELLKKLTQSLDSATAPVLSLHHPSPSAKIQKHDLSEFRMRLSGVIREAQKYGWEVDQHLKGTRW